MFTSTNERRTSPPGGGYLAPGWNLVGWADEIGRSPETALGGSGGAVRGVRAGVLSVPGPAGALPQGGGGAVGVGEGVWVHVDSPVGATWERPHVTGDRVVVLKTAMNLDGGMASGLVGGRGAGGGDRGVQLRRDEAALRQLPAGAAGDGEHVDLAFPGARSLGGDGDTGPLEPVDAG